MTTISGYRIRAGQRNPFQHWEALLEEWPLVIDRFARVTEGDVPYWYTERTNCGVVAAAAWRAGMVALEEYQVKKADSSNIDPTQKGKTTRNGRCDLWVGSDSNSLAIEAKHRWRDLTSKNLIKLSIDVLNDAISNARDTKAANRNPTAGIAFIPLYVKRKKVPTEHLTTEAIQRTVEQFENSSELAHVDLVSWCFPYALRNHTAERTKNALPGILMLGKSA